MNLGILLDYLNNAESVRVIILSNNFLNDECVRKICEKIQDLQVQTIDFSGNLLTKKSLNYILKLLKTKNHLKNVILENCPLERNDLIEA